MRQGEIWYADLNPIQGGEQAGFRPVVILSGNMMNKLLKVVIVCPLSSNVKNYKGNVVLYPDLTNNLPETSESLIFHLRSISKLRLARKIGEITKSELDQLRKGLDDILRY